MALTAKAASRERQSLRLVAEPLAVSEARAWVSEVADDLLDADRRPELALVVSEVVTNAVRHGEGGDTVELAATPTQDFLCVQVTDEGPGLAPRPRALAPERNGGYGLFIVEQLTRRWGVTREGKHTRVWFEFDYRRPAA